MSVLLKYFEPVVVFRERLEKLDGGSNRYIYPMRVCKLEDFA